TSTNGIYGQTARIWDISTGECKSEFRGHDNVVECSVFAPVESYPFIKELIVSCSNDLSIKVWDLQQDYKCVRTLHGHDHSVSSVTFMPSGDIIASASRDKTIKLWELATGFCVKTIMGHLEWVRFIQPSQDG
ncbi:protein with putative role during mitosis, partial [Haplosporangium sp. Z 27]